MCVTSHKCCDYPNSYPSGVTSRVTEGLCGRTSVQKALPEPAHVCMSVCLCAWNSGACPGLCVSSWYSVRRGDWKCVCVSECVYVHVCVVYVCGCASCVKKHVPPGLLAVNMVHIPSLTRCLGFIYPLTRGSCCCPNQDRTSPWVLGNLSQWLPKSLSSPRMPHPSKRQDRAIPELPPQGHTPHSNRK